jgi:homoserine O-acetyltransferase/O-succinyltransferase
MICWPTLRRVLLVPGAADLRENSGQVTRGVAANSSAATEDVMLGGVTAIGPWRTVWRPGDEPGRRRFASVGSVPLELGGELPEVVVCYETWGELAADGSNAILVLHGFTADSHAAGPAGAGHPEVGWWDSVIGPGKGIDTNRWFVVCPNVLGGCQGTTGPASLAPDGRAWGSRWPVTTPRDMVAVEALLADHLGIQRWHCAVGPSLGGMRVLEWCAMFPDRVAIAAVMGVGAQASAEQIALQTIQIQAITGDPEFQGGDYYDIDDGRGPVFGMGIARRVGHLSYRSELELHERFANRPQHGEDPLAVARGTGRYGVVSYLDYAATRLERRFDPNTYVAINEAMNHYDLGRGRGTIKEAMAGIRAQLVVVGLDGDRLYPLRLQQELVDLAPRPTRLHVVHSIVGHDAFLTEDDQVAALMEAAINGQLS